MKKDNYIDELETIKSNTTLVYKNLNILNNYLLDLNNKCLSSNSAEIIAKASESSDYLSLGELLQESIENINNKINEIIKELM